jgi:hypothetical protein
MQFSSPSEQRIDEAKDVESILAAVQAHVRSRYRNAPYSTGRDHLANIVAVEVLRRLPGSAYSDALAPYDYTRGRLSHLVNVLAKSRHLDEVRKLRTMRSHFTLACDLAQLNDIETDSLTYLSDMNQDTPTHERELALRQFMATVPATRRPATVRCIATGKIDDNQRKTFNKVLAQAEKFGRSGLRSARVSGCSCWECSPANLRTIPARRKRPAGDWVSIPTQRYR